MPTQSPPEAPHGTGDSSLRSRAKHLPVKEDLAGRRERSANNPSTLSLASDTALDSASSMESNGALISSPRHGEGGFGAGIHLRLLSDTWESLWLAGVRRCETDAIISGALEPQQQRLPVIMSAAVPGRRVRHRGGRHPGSETANLEGLFALLTGGGPAYRRP